MMRDLQAIRSAVTMKDALAWYGIDTNRHGYAACPFHDDRHPSMKVYPGDRGFYCFVCHEGGDIFRFIQRMDHCSFGHAVDIAAKIGGIDADASSDQVLAYNRQQIKNAWKVEKLKDLRFRYRLACGYKHWINRKIDALNPSDLTDELAELLRQRELCERTINILFEELIAYE